MNERIRELAEQFKTTIGAGEFGEYEVMMWYNAEEFAELIVRECADLCDRFQARDVGMQPAECAGAIRKMFGVE